MTCQHPNTLLETPDSYSKCKDCGEEDVVYIKGHACTKDSEPSCEICTPSTVSYSDHDPKETYDYKLGRNDMFEAAIRVASIMLKEEKNKPHVAALKKFISMIESLKE